MHGKLRHLPVVCRSRRRNLVGPLRVSLKYAILSLLAHDPLTGYELMKLFDGSVGYFWHATHPQIYKELARLERAGQIAHRSVEQRGRPTKKIYSLSELGRGELLEWLRIPARTQRVKDEMMLKTFCSGLLSDQDALELIRRHRELHQIELQRYQELERFLESGLNVASRDRLGPYLTLLRGIRYERDYIGWCDEATKLLQRLARAMPLQSVSRAKTRLPRKREL
jgi:DNA-binding PadR family transcriptional regulator